MSGLINAVLQMYRRFRSNYYLPKQHLLPKHTFYFKYETIFVIILFLSNINSKISWGFMGFYNVFSKFLAGILSCLKSGVEKRGGGQGDRSALSLYPSNVCTGYGSIEGRGQGRICWLINDSQAQEKTRFKVYFKLSVFL